MSNPSNLGVIAYAAESAFSESSTTFGERLPTVGPVDVSGLNQDRIDTDRTSNRRNESWHHIRGPFSGSVSVELLWTGHGSTAAGVITATQLPTFLGHCVGASATDSVGAALDGAAAGTAAVPIFAGGAEAFADGALCRMGEPSDGAGEGQALAVDNLTGANLTLLTAAPAAPAVNDVIYAMETVIPDSRPNAGNPTTVRLQFVTANQRYNLHGCQMTGIDFPDMNPGDLPRIRVTFAVSRWNTESASTWPSTDNVDSFSVAPIAAGSMFYNVYGTSTRQEISIRDFSLSINVEAGLKPGPDSATTNPHEMYVGSFMNRCQASFNFSIDAEAAGTSTFGDIFTTDENSLNYYHFLYTMSSADGKSAAIYFPYCTITSPHPVQEATDGYNTQRVAFEAQTSADVTSELTAANFVLGFG